ncbi:MAG: response regulator [Candidatus Omnitrophota bacterium]|nr:response regulator [Candidatus Omnitrophota bacterium]
MAKILIIDDDADMTEAMRVVLESKNHRVIIAKSGEEGMSKAMAERPELIILDVMMETTDKGFEVARELKKDDIFKNVPILMLTALKDKMGLDFKKEAGDSVWLPVEDYLEKPLKPEELISKVEHFLRR